jgi:DNA mismatch repair protein MutH
MLERAGALAGTRLVDVARALGVPFDDEVLLEAKALPKGVIGELIERALGIARSSRPGPDVHALGIEVKTLPIDASGRVHESTYVCRIALDDVRDTPWALSRARHKLSRVLFVLVEPAALPLVARRVGRALLWSPDDVEEWVLAADYEDHRDLVGRGLGDLMSASRGRALQVRPKAKNARARGRGFDEDGDAVRVAPRGFYLRPSFTESIVARLLG